ncbi:TetR family transcriptional regulator [Actinomycetospora sp. NBRC 106375]|nr:TetR family transcriptional regulator [Actinomycetospora sp. NBRC 106375]
MVGRRERKKAATRRALADAALELFLARGYEDVTVAEIAAAADVSVTTLFNHFPGGKPALVFDEAQARQEALVAAVRDRPADTGLVAALHAHLRRSRALSPPAEPAERERMERFLALVRGNRPVAEAHRAMWASQEVALTAAIAEEPGTDPEAAAALARLVLDGYVHAEGRPDPAAAFDVVMRLLAGGWDAMYL